MNPLPEQPEDTPESREVDSGTESDHEGEEDFCK